MADNIDPTAFGLTREDVEVNTADPASFGLTREDIQDLADPATGEIRRDFASGTSPDTPINRSPVSDVDRLKLSFSNERGRINFLKEKFDDVRKNTEGDLVVLNEGIWQQVDPAGLGEGSPWEKTRELGRDILDLADVAIDVVGAEVGGIVGAAGGAVAGFAVGTLPGSVVGATAGFVGGVGAGAALANGVNTTLGKAFGTFDATPEEANQELASDAILNMLGVIVPAGFRPVAKLMGKGISKGAPIINAMSNGTKEVIAQTVGFLSGTGAEATRHMLERPKEVGGIISKFAAKGASSGAAAGRMKARGIEVIKQVVNDARGALSKTYRDGLNQIKEQLPRNFKSPVKDGLNTMFKQAEETGLGKINPKTGTFALKSQDKLIAEAQQQGLVPEFVSDPEAFKMVSEFIDQANIQAGARQAIGRDAAIDQMVRSDQVIRNLAFKFKSQARDAKLNATRELFGNAENAFSQGLDEAAKRQIASPEGKIGYNALKRDYNETLTAVQPLFRAKEAAAGKQGDAAFESLLTRITASGTRQTVTKDALGSAVDKLASVNPNIAKGATEIIDLDTAAKFLPLTRGGLVQLGAFGLGVSSGTVTGLVAGAAATSPRLLGGAARAAANTAQIPRRALQRTNKQMRDMTNFVKRLTPDQLKTLASDEDLMRQLLFGAINAPDTGEILQQAGVEVPQ